MLQVKRSLSSLLNSYWYRKHWSNFILKPISYLYLLGYKLHKKFYTPKLYNFNVPIVVVGNITVGGVGKTPFVIELANKCIERGFKVGIISRGYNARCNSFPHLVNQKDTASFVGDEPFLIYKKTKCPLVIGPKRNESIKYLINNYNIDLIISDDGLQHHALNKDIEIVIIDSSRLFGNNLYLPFGPLREPIDKLNIADFVISNGEKLANTYNMRYIPQDLVPINRKEKFSNTDGLKIAAMTAIGNPENFFAFLTALNIKFIPYTFSDHHIFTKTDLSVPEDIIIMTEKDAVKCLQFSEKPIYYLPININIEEEFWNMFFKHKIFITQGS